MSVGTCANYESSNKRVLLDESIVPSVLPDWISIPKPQSVLASHDVAAGGLVLIIAALLEGGEIMLDGVEVCRKGREK